MKQKLLAGLAALVAGFGPTALGQPDPIWENWGQVLVPSTAYPYAPQIDAITFYNHPGGNIQIYGTTLFETSDTLNYTNQGIMIGSPGFDFQTYPAEMGQGTMAANFANLANGANGGSISCDSTLFFGGFNNGNLNFFFGNLSGNSKIVVRATNVVNSGTLDLTGGSLLRIEGKNVDLSRGNLNMANTTSSQLFRTNFIFFGINLLFNAGILDGYWAAETATNAFNPAASFGGTVGITQQHWVTNRDYMMLSTSLFGQTPYMFDWGTVNSNRLVQAVFLYNTDPSFVNSVYFRSNEIAVQWQWTTPAWPDPGVNTNYFYLTDNFGEVTNIGVLIDGFINPQTPLFTIPTYRPENYRIFQGTPYNPTLPAATPGPLPNIFDNGDFTNQYTAYEALFSAGTQLPTDIAGGAYSNMQGRIEITADSSLDLNRTRISSLNYLRLEATNHFKGSQNARISTPYADYNLRATNGLLTVSNVIAPFVPHPAGPCLLYSARWTNVVNTTTNTTTNCFHVLVVESFLSPVTTPQIANLKLAVTNSPASAPRNLVINDVLNITTHMELAAERITIGQNDADGFTGAGELNLFTPDIVWPASTPGLLYLTNWGLIQMQNAVFFHGSYTDTNNVLRDTPYRAFVNHSNVVNQGSLIWSDYFENDGLIYAGQGSITLANCTRADLEGGVLNAPVGQVSIAAASLDAANSIIRASGSIELSLTNSVTDGGPAPISLFSSNQWTSGNGFSLYSKPALGDLLGTTLSSTAEAYAEPLVYWAGEDRGRSVAGYSNNCAIGRLLLDGGTYSAFRFIGTGASNALYVDYLELDDSITNRDAFGNFTGLDVDPNMKVYFADAVAGGRSIAEKLDGKNGGRLVWVNSYAGAYSSTNLLYPDGRTYTFNRALVQSCNLDSDNDGIANCSDATPVFVPSMLQFSISLTNLPAMDKLLSWQALGNSSNSLYYNSDIAGTNWLLLTNFVFGPNNGTATVLDTSSDSTRYYRLRMDPRVP